MASTNTLPNYTELRTLLRSSLPGVSEAELDRAATAGLLQAFAGRVELLPAVTNTPAPVATGTAIRAEVLDHSIACLIVARVDNELPAGLVAVQKDFSTTNRWDGLVLDLRYATGDSQPAVKAVAEALNTRVGRPAAQRNN
jgi:hypothetical protein